MTADHLHGTSSPSLLSALFSDGSLEDAVPSGNATAQAWEGNRQLNAAAAEPAGEAGPDASGSEGIFPAPRAPELLPPLDSAGESSLDLPGALTQVRGATSDPPLLLAQSADARGASDRAGCPGEAASFGAHYDGEPMRAAPVLDEADSLASGRSFVGLVGEPISSGTPETVAGVPVFTGADSTSWLDLDDELLSGSDDDLLSDPVAEVDQVLRSAGIGTGAHFRDVLSFLREDLRTPSLLWRCLPGLAAAWDRLRHIVADVLLRVGQGLAPDPEVSLLPLLDQADVLPAAIDTCPVDALQLYWHELSALRLLSHEEQYALGLWIADGRYLAELTAAPHGRAVPAPEALDRCLAELRACWDTVIGALPARPGSATGWRAALTSLGFGGVGDEVAARVAAGLDLTADEARAKLRRAEVILRVLPDDLLVWLSEHLSVAEPPPTASGGHGAAAFTATLGRRIERADTAARVMVRHNLRLVASVARNYAPVSTFLELTDLIQEGTIGLMRAVERWEPARGYTFSTYATWWIKQAVTRAIADQDLVVRLPVHMVEQVRAALQARSLGPSSRSEEASFCDGELEQLIVLTRSPSARGEVLDLLRAASIPTLVAALIAGILDPEPLEHNAWAHAEAVPDEDGDGWRELEYEARAAQLEQALATLPARERDVMVLRYGLDGADGRTLEEVGRIFGVTRERIRQIEDKAIRRLRHHSRSRLLRPFLGDVDPSRRATPPPTKKLAPGRRSTDRRDEDGVLDALHARLSGLDETEREVLRLRLGLVDGYAWSYEAISRRLGLPVALVRWREADAVLRVRDLVEIRAGKIRLIGQEEPPSRPGAGPDKPRSILPDGPQTDAPPPEHRHDHTPPFSPPAEIDGRLTGLSGLQRLVVRYRLGLAGDDGTRWSRAIVARHMGWSVEDVEAVEVTAAALVPDVLCVRDGELFVRSATGGN